MQEPARVASSKKLRGPVVRSVTFTIQSSPFVSQCCVNICSLFTPLHVVDLPFICLSVLTDTGQCARIESRLGSSMRNMRRALMSFPNVPVEPNTTVEHWCFWCLDPIPQKGESNILCVNMSSS